MPQINILNILQGDNQSNIVDKINYNFDQILSAGGGPQGQQGLIGPTGPIGPQGPQGPQGLQGPSGTKWFVQDSSPASGSVTGSNPWTYPSIGDYWLDPDSADQDIYVFTATGWTYTGYGLAAGQIFQKLSPVNFNGGLTGQAILIAGTASPQAVVFSDSNINGITGYAPSGTGIDNINYENSKLKIATRNDRTKLISFSHSEFDVVNVSGTSGATGNYLWNPSIDWESSSPLTNNFYDIAFQNPKGAITIRSNGGPPGPGPTSGGVNLFANQEISAQSSSENIILKTTTNKGTFIDISSIGGFLELSTNSSPPANQSNAPLFANSTGLGLGLGTGQFKQTGNDPRRLAVLGNVTIGKSSTYHTQTLFEGYGPAGRDSGFLYVEGPAGFGPAIGPTAIGNGGTTGPAESQNVFPQVFISSPELGPALSVASLVGPSRTGRTVIGNGSYDSAAGNTIAAIGVDLTQEYYFAGGKGSSFSGGPMFSYQHKITDPTNTANTAPVFGITTYANSGSYTNATMATGTLIQTTNSNNILRLQANATTPVRTTQNRLSLGTNGYNKISVWGGLNSDEFGTVTIGTDSELYQGIRDFVLGVTVPNVPVPFFDVTTNDHSLYVTGFQTIGSSDPVSLFSIPGIPLNNYQPVGNASVLKIHRNLADSYTTGKGGILADGQYPNNYPNGLEITSFKRTGPTPAIYKGQNLSVAIAVGASVTVTDGSGQRGTANTTGFFVSDTGERVAIGTTIGAPALSVSGPGVDPAINATGGVKIVEGTLENYIPSGSLVNTISSFFGLQSSNQLIVAPNVSSGGYNSNSVAGDVFAGASNGGVYHPLTIGAQSGGGMRFYYDGTRGVAQTIDVLRTDTDITTNTNTPGWTVLPINAANLGTSVILYGNSSGNTGYNVLDSSYSYKVIGKTVHLSFIITGIDFTNSSNEFFFLPIPPNLYPVSNRTLGTTLNRIECGFAFYRNSNYSESEKVCQVQLRANTVPGTYPANMWYITLTGMTRTNQINPGQAIGSVSGVQTNLNTIALSKYFADTGPGGQQQISSSFQGSITYGLI